MSAENANFGVNLLEQEHYNAFLSHNNADKPCVEMLAQELEKRGISCWLDKWNLIPGDPWQPAVEQALCRCDTCVVFFGPHGLGPWHNEEMQLALQRRVSSRERKLRVLPVVLPGGQRDKESDLPGFLQATTWVEFRQSIADEEALHRLVCGIKRIPPGRRTIMQSGECPYVGLKTFQPEDAKLFFGRTAKVQELIYRLRKDFGTPKEERFLCLIGASGSGKSSLALAGLIPGVRRGELPESAQWPLVRCRPGVRPWENLQIALANDPNVWSHLATVPALITRPEDEQRRLHLTARLALHTRPETHRLFVLIDQFEEIFTLCNDENERRRLIDNVLYATNITEGRTVVVLTLRADFFGQCANYVGLRAAVADHQLLIGPLREEELREAIEAPAQLAGIELEPGLMELLLGDMKGQAGALPFLEHALFKLWECRDGRRLTAKAYMGAGRLQGALDAHAEDFFTQALTVEEQEWCRQILVDLVHPGEGTVDTKRRAALKDIAPTERARAVLQKLADARLVTTDREARPDAAQAELAHEALIGGWRRLGDWVSQDREKSRHKDRLLDSAREWQKSGRRADFLYRGVQLAAAKEQFGSDGESLPACGKEFLEASIAKRRDRRNGLLLLGIIPVVVLASFLYGLQHMSFLRELADKQKALLKANEELQKSQSEAVLAIAKDLQKDKSDPRASVLALAQLSRALDRDKHNVAAAEQACTLLLNRTWCPPLTPPLRYSSESPLLSATFDPDGHGTGVLAVSQDGWLLRSDDRGRALVPKQMLAEEIEGKKLNLVSASFSPDERALLLLWERDNRRKIVQFYSLADGFCKSGDRLIIDHPSVDNMITWSADHKLIIMIPAQWDSIACRAFYFNGTSYVIVDKPFGESPVLAVAFDPGSNLIATASPQASVQLWQFREGAFEKLADTPMSHSAFSLQEPHIRSMMFGKAKEGLFVVAAGSGYGVQVKRINIPANSVESFGFAATKDQFLKLVAGPRSSGGQLMATSLYSRVSINDSAAWNLTTALAEPICFQGRTALSIFDLTGSKLMTLSGSSRLAPDTVQIWDVSMRIKGDPAGEFHADGKPAPLWLAGLARAVSGIPVVGTEENAPILSDLLKKNASMAPDTLYSPYDKVWKHFFRAQASETATPAPSGPNG